MTDEMSLRDIGEIVNRAVNEKERQEHKSLFVQAYELFLQGKKPIQVAITLNIGEAQVSQYYMEYLRLVQLDDITRIYQELKGNVWYFVNLCKAAKSARMDVRHVVRLLDIAEYTYEQLQKRISVLKSNKTSLDRDLEYHNGPGQKRRNSRTRRLQVTADFYDSGGNNVGDNKTVSVSPSSQKSQQTGTFIIRAPISDMKGTASFVRLEYESNPQMLITQHNIKPLPK